jgi:hypothetical protein
MAAVEKIAEPEALSAMVWLRNIISSKNKGTYYRGKEK